MDIFTKAVHSGDRKKAGSYVPVTTPIYTAASYFYESAATLDRVVGMQEAGHSYSRYDNPTNAALEELVAQLEGGHGALATASGMTAVHLALTTALLERPKRVLAAQALYGATVKLLVQVMQPFGIELEWIDICDPAAVEAAIERFRPGAVLLETVSNPLLRVPDLQRIAKLAQAVNAALIVDNTFATPLLVRPLELGANLVVHSATKYLSGHGDVLGGLIVTDESHYETMRTLSRIYGPVMGPFESYLTMRGIKTFALRVERQCRNACRLASWLATHPRIERVYFPGDPTHPDAAAIRRLLPPDLFGAMVSFEIRGADKQQVFDFLDSLKLIVPATSLGDVHSMMLYPLISSHRELPGNLRERMGIHENLVRLSVGIEAVDDITADLEKALRS